MLLSLRFRTLSDAFSFCLSDRLASSIDPALVPEPRDSKERAEQL